MADAPKALLFLTVFLTGAAVLIVEILGTRILAPFYGSTIFVWSSLITTALAFLALGYIVGGRRVDQKPQTSQLYLIVTLAGVSLFLIPVIDRVVLELSDPLGLRFGPLLASALLFGPTFTLLGTVTPYAIRIQSKVLERSGVTAGNIFALATIGSLIGALLAGFFLLPLLPVSLIFALTGAIVAGVGFIGLITGRARGIHLVTMGLFAWGSLSFSVFAAEGPHSLVVAEKQSFYGDIKITADGNTRCLLVDATAQTCLLLPHKSSDALYIQQVADLVAENKPKNLLLLGMGAGAMLSVIPDEVEVQAVELDSAMVLLAETEGIVPERNYRINYDDARHFLRVDRGSYDLIVVDLYRGPDLPAYMFTREAFAEMEKRLSDRGMVFVNISASPSGETNELLSSVYLTMRDIFGDRVMAVSPYAEEDYNLNFIVRSHGAQLTEKHRPVAPASFYREGRGSVLRDDFNPIEYRTISLAQSIHAAVKQQNKAFLFVR